jgi:2-polyprenyl-3-methyl-5-hydroxy-6-metoxy-1,4-benzoquinol methylase
LDNISNYYQSEEYISHSNKSGNLVNFLYKIARIFTIKSKLKLLNSLHTHGKLLDFGTGTGEFLAKCKSNNWEVSGVEPEESARQQANKLTNGSVVENLDKLDKDEKFKIITLWHVLEHLPNPNETLIALNNLLTKNGLMIIAVPNCASWDANHYKEYWAGYDVPRHFSHFSRQTIGRLLKNNNLSIKNIIPIKLDAYYVSLLSEKYKSQNQGKSFGIKYYFRSLLCGWKSNGWASVNSLEYSSLIYVIKK